MVRTLSKEQIKNDLAKGGFQGIIQKNDGFLAHYHPLISHCHFSVFIDFEGNIKDLKDETDLPRIGVLIGAVIAMYLIIGCAPGALGIALLAYALREYNKREITRKIKAIFEAP